jgi:hypothetical protein
MEREEKEREAKRFKEAVIPKEDLEISKGTIP